MRYSTSRNCGGGRLGREQQRPRIIQGVRGRNTGPERTVRRLLLGLGYRYLLHRRDPPGKPDLVFVSRRKVILVHGCFWHAHGCRYGRPPKSRLDYWPPTRAKRAARRRGTHPPRSPSPRSNPLLWTLAKHHGRRENGRFWRLGPGAAPPIPTDRPRTREWPVSAPRRGILADVAAVPAARLTA